MTKNKQQRVITTHRDLYWPTSDEWYPNYQRNTVRVRIHDQTTGDNVFVRVSVWGADDCGMERDVYVVLHDKQRVIKELCALVDSLPNPLTKTWLRSQGFVNA